MTSASLRTAVTRAVDSGVMSSVVTASQMSDRYGSTEVLRSLDLDIPTGLTALLGPNGAGKTTLLHLLCGLRQPTAGSLSVMGVTHDVRDRRRRIAAIVGFLPQSFGFLPSYTVREFVTYAGWLKRVPKRELPRRVESALADVGMSERADKKMRTLSGGMVRRVGIATAIVHEPPLVVLDEPSAGLDPEQRRDLRALLSRVKQTSSVIVSTHLIEDVRETSDTVLVLADGTVRFVGSPDDLGLVNMSSAGTGRGSAGSGSMEDGYLAVLAGFRAQSPSQS